MPFRPSRLHIAAAFIGLLAVQPHAVAQGAAASQSEEIKLTPEELQERELRKACKVAICSAFHVRASKPEPVTCSVLKTWRKEQLAKMVSKGGLKWPWGKARCTADIKLDRTQLAKAMTEPKFQLTLDKHKVQCDLDRDDEGKKYTVSFEISPKVTFENGKAMKSSLGWGKIEAPALAKGALWSATAADNTFNVLQGTVVQDINDFIDKKCMEVKSEWQNG